MKKRILLMGLAAVLVMSAVAGGTLAAGQASAQTPVTAPLQAATLNIEWNNQTSEPVTLAITDEAIMPADQIDLTDSYKVDNTGAVDAYIRVTVTKYWADQNGVKNTDLDAAGITLFENSADWVKADSLFENDETMDETEVYYYKYPVPAGASTSDLLEELTIPADLTNEYTNQQIRLEAVADGVQFAGAAAGELNAQGILASWGVAAELAPDGSIISVSE